MFQVDFVKTGGVWEVTPGDPLTNFNDGGGGGVSDRSSYFITQKNHNFRICLPKKITAFFSIPKIFP